jgi:hypothetical protein
LIHEAKSFPHILFKKDGFLISCPLPRPRLQRQSLNVWPAGRWPQYEITFRAWSLTLHCFSQFWCGEKDFLKLLILTHAAATNSGRLAGQALALTRNNIFRPLVLFAFFSRGQDFMKNSAHFRSSGIGLLPWKAML